MTARLAIAAAVLLAATASAYESKCYREGAVAECGAGPDSARGHWIAPNATDEHRQIFEQTRVLAGLPATASGPFTLRIFTAKKEVSVDGGQVPSLIPAAFADAERVLDRPGSRTIGEFAQLPDFSFSLWDWARGHETCPLDPDDAQTDSPTDCHDFRTHMGPVNSSHFPPQAQRFYERYHGLALQRAQDCNAIETRLGADRARFHDYLLDCEREALILEAISHHFLQDAWSMGHMWERWGSPGTAEFDANRKGAIAVGMFSGMIHGARGVLQSAVDFAGYDVNDALCAPHPLVEWRRPADMSRTASIGDDYLPLLTSAGVYRDQYREMYSCTVSSLRDVYERLSSPELGAAGAIDPGLHRVAPSDCFTQRATNAALAQGAGLDLTSPTGREIRVELDLQLLSRAVPTISNALAPPPCSADQVNDPICGPLLAQFRMDAMAVVARVYAWRKLDPFGVEAASGSMPALMGFGVNSTYANQPLPSYVDPPLPWPAVQQADSHAFDLALTFHRAHAGDWCNALSTTSLNGLKQHLLDATAQNTAPDEIAAAKEACTEIAGRHTRTYTAGGKRPDGEPLCNFAAADPGHVAFLDRLAPTGTNPQAAASWCTCGNGGVDAGEECDPTAADGDLACPGHCLAPKHLRPIGSACVLDECTCGSDDTPSCGGILFVRQPDCEIGCGPGGDIWLMDEDGNNATNLTNTPTKVYMGYPKWSHDRRRMAYWWVDPADASAKIHVTIYNVAQRHSEGEVAVLATALDPRTFPSSPTWSPDDAKLAVEAQYGVHTIDLAHGNFMTWLPNPVYDRAPDWSPDGTRMAIVDGAVKIIPATGGPGVAPSGILPGYGPPFGNPRWSPDGDRLVFTSSSGIRIAVIDAAPNSTPTLLNPLDIIFGSNNHYQDATWSADGTRILFSYVTYDTALPTGIQRSIDLWVMDADGSNLSQLTTTEAKTGDPYNISEIGADW